MKHMFVLDPTQKHVHVAVVCGTKCVSKLTGSYKRMRGVHICYYVCLMEQHYIENFYYTPSQRRVRVVGTLKP